VIGMPLTEICNAVYSDPRQRQLFKNIVYVGALSVLLDIDAEVIEKLFGEQYKGKEKLLASNVQALHLGRDFAREHLQAPLGIRVKRADKVGDRIFVDGNSAAALGCVYGGATVAAWYPITPSSSVAEAFQKYCAKYRVDPPPARTTTPSCRPRTRSPPSAWWWARAGTARGPSPPPRARACR
jgi:2-oxoglutarate ferredoxin oxidoreductase subunit alpha